MKVLVLDNYDSFTYNLVHYLEKVDARSSIDVFRNDQIQLDKIAFYDKIVLSPGPGLPSQAGIMLDLIKRYAGSKPILGICLGHQAIAEAFGARLKNLDNVYHGVTSLIEITEEDYVFENLPASFNVGRYHSWVVTDMPSCLISTSKDENGNIMSLKHDTYDVRGIQFHPESVLTEYGLQIISNWINH
ncbi:MAG: aminodeoxychorismate/anthranilate synthase component II [Bacteroidia bacterium]|nr:aminodeoxychorismate/anthranilate synthase component II [Bacteroidia bacterium]